MKRLFIFGRRIVLAIFILVFPLFAETLLAAIIPGETNLINSLRGIVQNYGTNDLSMSQYGTQKIPYYVANNDATLTTALNNYHINSIPNAEFVKYDTDTINDDVLKLRQESISNLISNYYMGMSLSYVSNTVYAKLQYSTMAFHSGAALLNNIDNLILQVITGSNTQSITTVNAPIASQYTMSNSSSYLEILACLDSLPVSLLNFINSVIVAFIISIMVMAVTRERTNGNFWSIFL